MLLLKIRILKMRLEKYQNYYIKKIGYGIKKVLNKS